MERSRSFSKEIVNLLSIYPTYPIQIDKPDIEGVKLYVVKVGFPFPLRALIPGNYLYVLLPDGEFRFPQLPNQALSQIGDFHHPQLAKRKPVIGAGVFGLSPSGITFINNKSGCYRPDPDSLNTVGFYLKIMNIPTDENFKFMPFFH